MKKISIVDYGIGNILSVQRAVEKIGAQYCFVSTPREILESEYLILPGVGAFKNGMKKLQERDLIDAICVYCMDNRPFLGICLGMQMMLTESEEFGTHQGLNIIAGKIIKIPDATVDNKYQKIPHVGWNKLYASENDWKGTILDRVEIGEDVYFVHSFMAKLDNGENLLAETQYGGIGIPAVIRKGNCYGTQFHPEKSGEVGLRILERFITI